MSRLSNHKLCIVLIFIAISITSSLINHFIRKYPIKSGLNLEKKIIDEFGKESVLKWFVSSTEFIEDNFIKQNEDEDLNNSKFAIVEIFTTEI